MAVKGVDGRAVGEGLKTYYRAKIEELEIQCRDKQHNLLRLEAQRNELNTKGEAVLSESTANGALGVRQQLCFSPSGRRLFWASPRSDGPSCASAVRLLREELQLLQEPGSYVGEVIKASSTAAPFRHLPWGAGAESPPALHSCNRRA
jgi:26S proteasome regulatory subunit T6